MKHVTLKDFLTKSKETKEIAWEITKFMLQIIGFAALAAVSFAVGNLLPATVKWLESPLIAKLSFSIENIVNNVCTMSRIENCTVVITGEDDCRLIS